LDQNNNFSIMLGLQLKFGSTPAAPPPPPPVVAPPSFMVFFDWDRSNLSAQALNTIKQAAGAYKAKGNARITATGHTDTSGSEAYNMALSLRRANAVKDALVAKACRRPRSRWWAVASRACWCRPARTSASRRTAASKSSSSKTIRSADFRNGRGQPRPFPFSALCFSGWRRRSLPLYPGAGE
jgi:hypothetical protein